MYLSSLVVTVMNPDNFSASPYFFFIGHTYILGLTFFIILLLYFITINSYILNLSYTNQKIYFHIIIYLLLLE